MAFILNYQVRGPGGSRIPTAEAARLQRVGLSNDLVPTQGVVSPTVTSSWATFPQSLVPLRAWSGNLYHSAGNPLEDRED